MPMKLNVGLNRKIGEANYGSRGACVNLELELDSALVQEPARLQDKIRQLFALVRNSLAEELNGGNGHAHPPQSQDAPARANGAANGANGTDRVNGQRSNGPRPATQSQVKAIHAIARRQTLDLSQYLSERFQVNRPEDLNIQTASQVIDDLKNAQHQGG